VGLSSAGICLNIGGEWRIKAEALEECTAWGQLSREGCTVGCVRRGRGLVRAGGLPCQTPMTPRSIGMTRPWTGRRTRREARLDQLEVRMDQLQATIEQIDATMERIETRVDRLGRTMRRWMIVLLLWSAGWMTLLVSLTRGGRMS
jgi:hypothetical protein